MPFDASNCMSLERCARSDPPPLASSLMDGSVILKPHSTPPGAKEAVSVQDILRSVLRQESNLREEQLRLRSLLEEHRAGILDKLEELRRELKAPPSWMCETDKDTGGTKQAGISEVMPVPAFQGFVESNRHGDCIKLAKDMARAHAAAQEEILVGEKPAFIPESRHGLGLQVTKIVLGKSFDVIMGLVILVNMLTTTIQLEWQGYESAQKLGLRTDSANWDNVRFGFDSLEYIFNLLYLVELVMRVYVFRLPFFRNWMNTLDVLIVLSTCSDTFVFQHLGGGVISLSALRIMRFGRVFRMGRMTHVLHSMEHLREMRILIQTLAVSVRGLVWSVILIGGIILAASIVMVQLSNSFLFDDRISYERRKWLFDAFGTIARAAYTMFECTFTGQWANYAGPLIEEVHSAFAFFFIPYTVLVNFAVMRVVAALFLKQTMKVADSEGAEEEKLILKEKEKIAGELAKIFASADTSGNGAISEQEFHQCLANEDVIVCFAHLELQIDEAVALFGVLCADDGEADYEEFLNGALKVNGGAKTIDTLQILHQVLEMHKVFRCKGNPGAVSQ